MIQCELPLARTTDPLTSKAAAESAKAFKARDISRIFCCLQDFGPMTYRELAQRLGMEAVAVGRRGAEMKRKSLITVGPDQRDGSRIWRAIP